MLFEALPAGEFEVILADPPWRYDFTKVTRWGIDIHYPTLTVEEVSQLPVAGVSARNSILFLWATSPKLPWGLEVMKNWGWEYKTSLIWDKGGLGMGYWVRVNHEILLIGTRGKPKVPEVPARPASILRSPRRRHSQKPSEVYEIVEAMAPEARRLELFARNCRKGWIGWGLETPEHNA